MSNSKGALNKQTNPFSLNRILQKKDNIALDMICAGTGSGSIKPRVKKKGLQKKLQNILKNTLH